MKRTAIRFQSWVAAVCGAVVLIVFPQFLQSQERELPKLRIEAGAISPETKRQTSYAGVVKEAAQSVVSIHTSRMVAARRGFSFGPGDPFRFFFGPDTEDEMRERFGREPEPRQRRQEGLGSGVIVSEDGYILTNNHVIEGAEEIKVTLADGTTELDAEVIGADPKTDVAVIRVEAGKLPAIVLADSDLLEVGDMTLAIGNPFNLSQTVTAGIVSAMGRGQFGIVSYEDFIQTDASINPGNSGGALVDAEGRLIGINTFIMSRSGGNQGVGFAIPINLARSVMEKIIRHGEVVRGFLGVQLQPLDAGLAREFGLEEPAGALAADVLPGMPADKAGIKAGDVIVEFNGIRVNDLKHLRFVVADTAPETDVKVKVLRGGKEKELTARLEVMPEDPSADRRTRGEPTPKDSEVLKGVEVSDLTDRLREEYGVPDAIRGALVTGVAPDSAAHQAGLREGDVLQEIEHEAVPNADQAVELSRKIGKKRVLLRVWSRSRGGSFFMVVDESSSR